MTTIVVSKKWVLLWVVRLTVLSLLTGWLVAPLLPAVLWACAACLIYLGVRYHRYYISFNKQMVKIHFISIYTVRREINFKNLQHISLLSSPFQRMMGLSSVLVSGMGVVTVLPCLRQQDAQLFCQTVVDYFQTKGEAP